MSCPVKSRSASPLFRILDATHPLQISQNRASGGGAFVFIGTFPAEGSRHITEGAEDRLERQPQ